MVETLKDDTCATCGNKVVYIVTASSGLWVHADGYRGNHWANPVSKLPQGVRK